MWERGINKKNGTFSFTVWDSNGCVVDTRAGFKDHQECDRAAETANRDYLMKAGLIGFQVTQEIANMTDDELLAALGV